MKKSLAILFFEAVVAGDAMRAGGLPSFLCSSIALCTLIFYSLLHQYLNPSLCFRHPQQCGRNSGLARTLTASMAAAAVYKGE